MKKRKLAVWSLILIFCFLFGQSARAMESGSYYYDNSGKAHEAPGGYSLSGQVRVSDFGVGGCGKISDIAADSSGNIYLLSSETGNIILLDRNLNYVKTIIPVFGSADNCIGAEGMFISEYNGEFNIYIADTMHSRIIKTDSNASVVDIYEKPDTSLISDETEFNPTKLTVNESGCIFVICRGIYSGAVILDRSGEFLGFYGSNKIKLTATVIYDYFWKTIFGSSQRIDVSRYVPVEFSNLEIDDKGFIYTVTASKADDTGIKYMNFAGENLYPEKEYGDLENLTSDNEELKTSFIDLAYLGEGIIAALDTSRNRIFVYNGSGDLLTVFGGQGNYSYTFTEPAAIAAYEDGIYVYDANSSVLSLFVPNSYGEELILASRLYSKGRYDESKELWQSVLEQNNGFQTAYISIGRTFMSQNNYREAMKYFELGNSKTDYSQAKAGERKLALQKWFLPVFVLSVLLTGAVFWLLSGKMIKRKNELTAVPQTLLYYVFHPVRAGTAFVKKDSLLSNWLLLFVLPVWFVTNIISTEYSGFIFNTLEEHPLDLRVEFIATFVAALAFVASNWLIVTMTEGNGRLKEIAAVVGAGLIPYIAGKLLTVALSNLMLIEEAMIVYAPVDLCTVWSAAIIISGLSKIHEFSIFGTIKNIFFTVFGMLAIAFLLLLEISILKQIQVLLQTVFDELIMIIS